MALQDPSRPNRRVLQAAQTRRDILDTAVRLFAEKGYARTSVADIARETGVAVQTIYGSVGQKHQLMTALLDDIDERAGIPELVRQFPQLTDPRAAIALTVLLTRQLNERCADVLAAIGGAVHVEPELAALWQNGMERHRNGCRQVAEQIAPALRPGQDVETAAATIDAITQIDTWVRLRGAYGWDYDRIEQWMTATLVRLLLREDGPLNHR